MNIACEGLSDTLCDNIDVCYQVLLLFKESFVLIPRSFKLAVRVRLRNPKDRSQGS